MMRIFVTKDEHTVIVNVHHLATITQVRTICQGLLHTDTPPELHLNVTGMPMICTVSDIRDGDHVVARTSSPSDCRKRARCDLEDDTDPQDTKRPNEEEDEFEDTDSPTFEDVELAGNDATGDPMPADSSTNILSIINVPPFSNQQQSEDTTQSKIHVRFDKHEDNGKIVGYSCYCPVPNCPRPQFKTGTNCIDVRKNHVKKYHPGHVLADAKQTQYRHANKPRRRLEA